MNRCSLILAAVLLAAPHTQLVAGIVFTSGDAPDLTDQSNFTYNDNLVFGFPTPPPDAFYYLHTLAPGTPAAPVTVRSIEFYGYTEWIDGSGDPNHGFELNFSIDGPAHVLNLVRTDVGPAFATDLGVSVTPVQRIQIDIEPVVFEGDNVILRGDTGLFADFFMALADPAIGEIELHAYNDLDFTVIDSVTSGAAFQFTFFDTFQTMLPGDANDDGAVDLLDLDILGANFGRLNAAGVADGDFNGDGAVDLLDLDILGANFGGSLPGASVPEPAAILLAAFTIPLGGRVLSHAQRVLD